MKRMGLPAFHPGGQIEYKLRTMRHPKRLSLLYLCASVFMCGQLLGCANPLTDRRPAMFGPAAVRINPTFTRLQSFDSDKEIDGIEADIELRDEFGDATKAGGAIFFELFDYDPRGPDVRGEQIGEAIRFDLSSVGAQRRHWQNVIRSYRFQLRIDELDPAAGYVLAATWQPPETARNGEMGKRLQDRLVVTPAEER